MKAQLRKRLLTQRLNLTDSQHQQLSKRICAHLHELIRSSDWDQIFGFTSFRNEPDLSAFYAAIKSEVSLALPVTGAEHSMDFWSWNGQIDQLEPGPYGIMSPPQEKAADTNLKTLILVPALAVDCTGKRLGYGGGYYDRYLKSLPSHMTTVAVVFSEFFLDDLESEDHDVPVQSLVTEKGFVNLDKVSQE